MTFFVGMIFGLTLGASFGVVIAALVLTCNSEAAKFHRSKTNIAPVQSKLKPGYVRDSLPRLRSYFMPWVATCFRVRLNFALFARNAFTFECYFGNRFLKGTR